MTKKSEPTLEDVINQNIAELDSGKVEEQILELVTDSPIESYASRRTLAEAVILCRLQIRILTQKALEQTIKSEEMRCLPGLVGQLNKLLQTLQVVAPKDDDDQNFM